jgi:PII-like signaling protein
MKKIKGIQNLNLSDLPATIEVVDFGKEISQETKNALDDIDRNILNAMMKADKVYLK